MGKLWLAGEIPVLTTSTFWGGNILSDMVLSPFCPQVIIASIITALTTSIAIPVLAFTLQNLLIAYLGGYLLSAQATNSIPYRHVGGFAAATNPIFLYIYSASWWNVSVQRTHLPH